MEKCFRCGVNEEEAFLYDALYGFENVRVCDACSAVSGIPVIKTPTPEQLKASERAFGVRARLSSLVGLKPVDKTSEAIKSVRVSDKIELPELNKPRSVDLVFKLVDNFHWIIQTTRRRKGYSAKQLAEGIGESVGAVELLEKGKIPGNSLDLIIKIEQFLGIVLVKRKSFETDKINSEENIKESFLEKGQREEREEIIIDKTREENVKKLAELAKENDDKNVDFSRHSLRGVTVSDLKRINKLVEKDSPKKSLLQTGEEQFEGFGKENMDKIRGNIERQEHGKAVKKETPSIHDLMKLKQERDKRLVGKDIEIIKENKRDIDFEDLE